MNRLFEIVTCLCATFVGTSAILCYDYLELHCSGDQAICDLLRDEYPSRTLLAGNCVGAPSMTCGVEFVSVESDSVIMSATEGRCYISEAGGLTTGCHGREELEKIPAYKHKPLDAIEEIVGKEFDEISLCLCDTDFCNGVPPSSVSVVALIVSLIVSLSGLL